MSADGIRLDKWLWRARFFKSRSLAGKACNAGKVRVNGDVVQKSHYIVRVGNVLTFSRTRVVHVVRIEALGTRRGPAMEARKLYTSLDSDL